MKLIYFIAFTFIINSNILFAQKNTEIFSGCGTDQLLKSNPILYKHQKSLDSSAYKFFKQSQKIKLRSFVTKTIPVVVHIIHNGGSENISDAQVQAAIAHYNTKYSQSNADLIQFCLAQRDPNGNATNGITRNVSSLTTETMEVDDIALKDINRWDPNCYLNIWVIKDILSTSSGNGVVGYAYFPSAHGLNMDGLVIEANYFGSSLANDAVGSHEIGHYLGLYHTFQNGCSNFNCLSEGDNVCDTPPDQTTFASCNPPTNSCSTDADDKSINNPFTMDVSDDSQNYMDYSSISCYAHFTTGQYDRMQYFLSNVRNSLLTCRSCVSPCPAPPILANITTPSTSTNITIGTTINFAGTVTNTIFFEWYINPNTILSNALSASHAFNIAGSYWMKFRAISSNPIICSDGLDSVLINVSQPVVTSCVGSLEFDSLNSALRLPDNNQYYSGTGFTWECWFKLTTPFFGNNSPYYDYTRFLIGAIDNVCGEDIALCFGWGAKPEDLLTFKFDGPGGCSGGNDIYCEYVRPGGFLLGTWYHAAGVMDYHNSITKLFVNGQLVDSKPITSQPITRVIATELSYDVIVGPGYSYPPLGGNMDEVRIWHSVRTDAEILNNYNKCLVGNEANLLVYYRCNQTSGSVALDASVNHSDGTLSSKATWSNQEPVYAGSNCSIGCTTTCPAIAVSGDATVCAGSSAILTASGATTYTWLPATGLNATTGATVIATPTVTTTYTVVGTGTNCSDTAIVTVVVNNKISNTLNLGNDISLCLSGTHTFDAGTGFKEYKWQDGSTNQTFTAFRAGKYWVTVKNYCDSQILSDTVTITLAPTPTLYLGNDVSICSGDSVHLSYSTNGIYITYQWSPSIGLSCTTCPNPIAKPLGSTKYYLVASTIEGCTNIDSILIKARFTH